MKRVESSLFLILLVTLLSCKSEDQKMILPKDLELVNLQTGKDSVCFSCANQVIVFSNSSFFPFSEAFLWTEIREQFPEIGFIFYFSGEDKDSLTQKLAELKFPFPVFHDPEFRFYQENLLDTINTTYDVLYAFHVKNGFYKKPAQIGMQKKFVGQLEEILVEK
ncbi:hypothetical protein MMU07_12000 [Aquiflexum sp. LQ15W]|uniref:hypothetical protein n=1 Tax=Cognataquiflexum nitidum TaxID=2922272 RepID=UPI001F13C531|nr:hypothetical protein [Cognataquiflexum nitidum]MCH6200305.1 hypothetical protein [Cognataquiflexum nitidum]